jgi:hypothetical protein
VTYRAGSGRGRQVTRPGIAPGYLIAHGPPGGPATVGDATAMTSTGYNWAGPYFPGAMRERRALKRQEAEARNARTSPARRRGARPRKIGRTTVRTGVLYLDGDVYVAPLRDD